jgi:hypothetical protein
MSDAEAGSQGADQALPTVQPAGNGLIQGGLASGQAAASRTRLANTLIRISGEHAKVGM